MTLISCRRLLSSCVWSLISWRVLSLNGCAVSCWCSQSLKGLPGFHRRVNKLDLGCRPGTWSIPSYSQGLRLLKGALTTELNHSIDGHNILVLHPDKSHLLHRWISSNRRRLVIVHNNKFDLIPFGILRVRYCYSTRSKRFRDYVVVRCELFPRGKLNSSTVGLRNFAGIKMHVTPLSSLNLTGLFLTLIVVVTWILLTSL